MIHAMKHLFLRAVFPALLLCQMAAAQQNVRTVFLVRHAEKASTAADAPLSPEGEKRAECLAATLKDAGIKQIYVTDVTRTQQTAAPLAKALKIKPTILPAKDPNALIKNLAYTGGGNILVVGHSDTVPFVRYLFLLPVFSVDREQLARIRSLRCGWSLGFGTTRVTPAG